MSPVVALPGSEASHFAVTHRTPPLCVNDVVSCCPWPEGWLHEAAQLHRPAWRDGNVATDRASAADGDAGDRLSLQRNARIRCRPLLGRFPPRTGGNRL